MSYDTALEIVNDALLEMGVVSALVESPYTSTDPNVIQACALLKALGQTLARKYQWSDLQKTHTFSTVNGTESYALPADFSRLLPSTEWNRTTEQRLLGPVSPQGWQVLKSTSAVAGITYWYRKVGKKILVYPTPTSAEMLAYEYQSEYWVQPVGQSVPLRAEPIADDDILWFDRRLLVTGLKLAWRNAKRMDSSVEANEYADAWESATGGDSPAPDIAVGGNRGGMPRMIDGANVPETGFGT